MNIKISKEGIYDKKISFDIPQTWMKVRLNDICKTTSGGTPSRKNMKYYKGNIPWLKSGELKYNVIDSSEEHITETALENSSSKIIHKGTILIALYGATVGKLGILGIDAAINQAICAIFLPKGLENKFLYWFLYGYRDNLLNSRKGGAQPNISQQIINDIIFPLPPLNEQKRIVSKLEELFTKLDAGIEYLKKTQILLKQYRQSVLKYAFEGKLTEKWRKENKGKIESAISVLEKIRKKSVRKKNESITEYQSFNSGLWIYSKLSDLVLDYKNDIVDGPFGSNLHASEYVEKGIPIVRLQNVDRNRFVDKNIRFITNKKAQELKRHNYRVNDILITKLGDPLGKACIVPDTIDNGIVIADVVRMRIDHPYILNKYVTYAINSPKVIEQFPRPKGSTRPRVNLNHIRDVQIPVAPYLEQIAISDRIEFIFSIIETLERNIEQNLIRSKILNQTILKNAFEGKLVPQDPNDEPAYLLLEKIRQEKSVDGKQLNISNKKMTIKQNPKQTKLEF